ncbi:MAG TPA: S8 family serine peptidase [Thermomicrobiales bacterium]|jgi:subtilisin family serine protease
MRHHVAWLAALILVAALVPATLAASATTDARAGAITAPVESGEYVVLYAAGAALTDARAAITRAGGLIVRENTAIGLATVRTTNIGFLRAIGREPALAGATINAAIGRAFTGDAADRRATERAQAERAASIGLAAPTVGPGAPGAEPLASLQWDMRAIGATADGAHTAQAGDRRVLVGIIDTGIDGNHPDIAPNFNRGLSRNFTTDIPLIDGPCAEEADRSCDDPADVDEDGHGTHVAGTIGAAINGLGIAGVAPNVTLVNLRAGQDSGFFFLQPTVDALTYAGENGIDVVNMSFFVDPWVFNCASNAADSPEAQLEQRTIVAATQRALTFARERNVTLVAAAGNEYTDLGNPTTDTTSPDYPPGSAHPRTIDNGCLSMPTEGEGVIVVSATGPSGRKAYYSNYGIEQTTVAAPGGDLRDFYGTPDYQQPRNLILAPYPEAVARANDELNADGTPKTPFVVRDCQGGTCAYYQYLQGTSMAAPHVTGVVALIVSQHGTRVRPSFRDPATIRMDPAQVEAILTASATPTPCPAANPFDYPALGAEYNAACTGDTARNGFYGAGIVNAQRAIGLAYAPEGLR